MSEHRDRRRIIIDRNVSTEDGPGSGSQLVEMIDTRTHSRVRVPCCRKEPMKQARKYPLRWVASAWPTWLPWNRRTSSMSEVDENQSQRTEMTGRSRPSDAASVSGAGWGGWPYVTRPSRPPSQDCAIVLVHACHLSIAWVPAGLGRICAPPARHCWVWCCRLAVLAAALREQDCCRHQGSPAFHSCRLDLRIDLLRIQFRVSIFHLLPVTFVRTLRYFSASSPSHRHQLSSIPVFGPTLSPRARRPLYPARD